MDKFFALPYIKYSIITIVTLLIAFVISKVLRILIDSFIKRSSNKLRVDYTQFNFLKNAVTFIIFLVAVIFIFFTIPKLKTLSLSLFAGAGILAAIALFASQQAFANIVSGIFIVIFKPFRVNDLVDVGSLPKGRVEDITLRHTVLRNFENRRMIILNSVINSEILINSNIVDETICNFLNIGISYDSDLNKSIKEQFDRNGIEIPFPYRTIVYKNK